MNLLAIDTSTEMLSLAIQVGDQTFDHEQIAGVAASQLILPQIQALLTRANIRLQDLDCIAFGAGPGAFTGVRITCGVVQGLAFGVNIPVVGVNTLMAVAEASRANKVITCIDARMGEIYHAAWVKQQGVWQSQIEVNVCKPELASVIHGQGWLGAGNGWGVYAEQLTAKYVNNVSQINANINPTACAILAIATPIFAAGLAKPASEAMPIYIRNRVALTTQERAQGLRL